MQVEETRLQSEDRPAMSVISNGEKEHDGVRTEQVNKVIQSVESRGRRAITS